MRKFHVLVLLFAFGVLAIGGSSALAGQPGYTCSGGTTASPTDILGSVGPYGAVTVTGVCRFNGDVTINGNLTIADGAILNADPFGSPPSDATQVPYIAAHVTINGNVSVGKGAILGLGNYGAPGIKTNTVVNGNINANQPLDLYLSGITVHGNVISNGGGPGTNAFMNFPTKDDVIDGNLIIHGWQGGWIGVIRDTVGGNVDLSNNTSVITDDPSLSPPDPDSTEIMSNTIAGNLICQGNAPTAQIDLGDGGQANVIGGSGVGECADERVVPSEP